MTDRFDVFLSHCSADKAAVRAVAERLSARRIRVWLDAEELRPGLPWQDGLEQGMAASSAVAVFVGPAGLGAWEVPEMQVFLDRARRDRTPVIPVLLPGAPEADVLPAFLRLHTWVDLRQGVDDAGIDRLEWGIKGIKPWEQRGAEAQRLFDVPFRRNVFFTGRDDLLRALRARLTREGTAALGQTLAISGLGGIGKTQTALEYAHLFRDGYKAVFFVRAETEAELLQGLVRVAARLGLAGAQEQEAVARAVVDWLEANGDWLLIFDNADEPSLLGPYLPQDSRGHLLVTSRARVFDTIGVSQPFELGPMEADDGVAFLLRRTNRAETVSDGERAAAADLAATLGYLPLALEQAGAYLLAKSSRFADYLASYQQRGLDLLEKGQPRAGAHRDSVARTWLMNFEAVEALSPAAADILRLSAFLGPDDIPLELLTDAADLLGDAIAECLTDAANDPLLLDEALEALTRYSLIQRDLEARTFSVHRLVQVVVQASLGEDEKRVWAERAIFSLNKVFPSVEFETWPICDRLLPHALVAAKQVASLGVEKAEAPGLLNQAAHYLYLRARHAEAEPLMRRALSIDESSYGPHHPSVATELNNLATLLQDTNRLSEAEPLMRRALSIDESSYGPDHPDVARDLNNLATLLQDTNRLSEAEPLMRRALSIDESSYGPDHPDVACDLNNLAQLLKDTNRLSEGEPLMRRALSIDESSYGPDHPNVARDCNNLTGLLKDTNRRSEAEPLMRRAVAIYEQSLGGDHPRTQNARRNLELLLAETE